MSTNVKLNRSFSESELYRLNYYNNVCVEGNGSGYHYEHIESNGPVVKKTVLIIEEVYHGSPVVLRSGKSMPNRVHSTENLDYERLISNNTISASNADIRLNRHEQPNPQIIKSWNGIHDGVTPMDVDITNLETEGRLDIESMEVDIDHYNYRKERLNSLDTTLKKRAFKQKPMVASEKVSLENKTQINPILPKKKAPWCNSIIFIIVLISLLIFLYIWIFQGSIIFVNSDIQLQNIQKDLSQNVYGQKGSINVVIKSLEHRGHWANKIKVLGFIGSAGVGKTFVGSILKKHFHQELVHELYGIQLNFRAQWENILSRIRSCCLNLIIIDDLNKNDIVELFALVHSLPKNNYILIISIFSIQYSDDKLNYVINYDDINEIRREFENSNLFHELAVFHQFNIYEVKDWLKKQLQVQNVKYSEKLLNNILYNHNALYEGFKGLYSKLLLELESKM